jgi:tRNA A-37 threonylcarbamoyl transferase component Bud32
MMTETAICCNYRRIGKATVVHLGVLWSLACLVALYAGFGNWEFLTAHMHWFWKFLAMATVVLGGGVAFAWMPFQLLTSHLEGGLLTANEEGLTLPGGEFGFGSPRLIRWNELATVHFAPDQTSGHLVLLLRDGSKAVVSLAGLGEAAERFIVALEVWATNAEWTASAVAKRDELQNASVGLNSFTRLWDDELNRRFSSTNFVPLEPGTKLQHGRYSIVRQMAFGGFSAVYLAQDEQGRKVVLKEALFSNQQNEQSKESELFQREAKILAELNHDRIARIFDQFVDSHRHYLVIEFIDGENLRDVVRQRGKIDEATVRRWAIELAEILEFLHRHKPPILHRDFTPENLILNREGQLCLVDFGAANELIERATGTFIGKQCYMPPEQVRGKAEPASDFYALGCTLFFLLTGKDPQPLATCSPRALNLDVSVTLDWLVRRLTDMEPADRPTTPAAIKDGLASSSTIDLSVRRQEVR